MVTEFAANQQCSISQSQKRNTILCQNATMLHGVEPTIAIKISPSNNFSIFFERVDENESLQHLRCLF